MNLRPLDSVSHEPAGPRRVSFPQRKRFATQLKALHLDLDPLLMGLPLIDPGLDEFGGSEMESIRARAKQLALEESGS